MSSNMDQVAIIRMLTPQQKYRAAMSLLHAVIRMKEASLKAWFPSMSAADRKRAMRDFILYARS